jgi:hypothetical protein
MLPCECSIVCKRHLVREPVRRRRPRSRKEKPGWAKVHPRPSALVLADPVPPDHDIAEPVPLASTFIIAIAIAPAWAPIPVSVPVPIPVPPTTIIVPVAIHPRLGRNSSREATRKEASCQHNRQASEHSHEFSRTAA